MISTSGFRVWCVSRLLSPSNWTRDEIVARYGPSASLPLTWAGRPGGWGERELEHYVVGAQVKHGLRVAGVGGEQDLLEDLDRSRNGTGHLPSKKRTRSPFKYTDSWSDSKVLDSTLGFQNDLIPLNLQRSAGRRLLGF
jgi:hypothetical protein